MFNTSVNPEWTHQWVLWVSVWCYALHILEEYFYDWRSWAARTLGLTGTWQDFFVLNGFIMVATIASAEIGWRFPMLALSLTAVWGVNAIFFHIGPTLYMRVWSPGTFTATLLYLPVVALVYWGAHADGVLNAPALWGSITLGFVLMFGLVGAVRLARSIQHRRDAPS
ncbi:MAG: HXXEE domain-containing protein [Phycisphaerales bacterium]|nr:HXXEE domain-containing protein [Phycisphaerales bacterium]